MRLLLVLATVLVCSHAALLSDWAYEGHWYELHDGNAADSLNDCIDEGLATTSPGTTETGHPTCITSSGEYDTLFAEFDNEVGWDNNNEMFILWATDTATEDNWVWGCPAPENGLFSIGDVAQNGMYTNWRNGQPNDQGGGGQDYGFNVEDGWSDYDDGGDNNVYCLLEFNDYDECIMGTPCASGETCTNTYGSFMCGTPMTTTTSEMDGGGGGDNGGGGPAEGGVAGIVNGVNDGTPLTEGTSLYVLAGAEGGVAGIVNGVNDGTPLTEGTSLYVLAGAGGLLLCCCIAGITGVVCCCVRRRRNNDSYMPPFEDSEDPRPKKGQRAPPAIPDDKPSSAYNSEAPVVEVGDGSPLKRAKSADKLNTVKNVPISRIEDKAARAGGTTDGFDDALSDLLCDSTLVPASTLDTSKSGVSAGSPKSLGPNASGLVFEEEPYV